MSLTTRLPALLLAFGAHGLNIHQEHQSDKYSVWHNGELLFSADDGVAVFCDGAWHSSAEGSLKLISEQKREGSDRGLGHYWGLEQAWRAGNTRVVTIGKTYATGQDVAFQYSFPEGAAKTSTVELAASGVSEVIVNFPAFTTVRFNSSLSWEGTFAQAKFGEYSTGPTGGPTVFFNTSDLSTVVVGSPLNNFKATSAGPGRTFKGTRAWVPGTPGTIESLPAKWTQSFLLHLGSTKGITAAIDDWGAVLRRSYGTWKLPDVTLKKIGYQTDNGAYYVICKGNCSDTLLRKAAELRDLGIDLGYVSFQGMGASSTAPPESSPGKAHPAPWCVDKWSADGGLGAQYPMPLPEFQKALGLPLQLYAPYFCLSSEYFAATSPWRSVQSDSSSCNGYEFQDVAPDQSHAFYDWLFAKGEAAGMVSFEPDFMKQNYNCIPAFTRSATNSTTWQRGMSEAALARKLPLQWCMAAPTDFLASLSMPAVTNFRVSNDFCYGGSWDVGASSLLAWAVGAAPSKDTLWTTTNGDFVVEGCPRESDHEKPAVELQVVVALMTTGPVGISDGLGFTNATLVRRIVRHDGTLLKPSKPLTSVDSLLVLDAKVSPPGFVFATYSGASRASVAAYYFVSFKMKHKWTMSADDFYPPLQEGSKYVYWRFRESGACANNTPVGDCVSPLADSAQGVLSFPASDWTNTTGGTDMRPVVTTVVPLCPSRWALLGDMGSYVALSEARFRSVTCTQDGISFVVLGSADEAVRLTLLGPERVLSLDVKLPAGGELPLHFAGDGGGLLEASSSASGAAASVLVV
eukprot:TRINITY_DN31017_c0_g1_i1.p1 TRINITY_DN31017_c0_g1~~TRINITY_DN31017_c0_g1_i1.p1  ORF type:complete len:815 (-),score=114.77 TRINITY_DN31017_c0_g1_i1:44-2446(-)